MSKVVERVKKGGHPKGLYLLFFTEMWERFSYYGMRAILILYLTKKLVEGGLGMDTETAYGLYGYFTALVYATPLFGGYLADKYLGQRVAITIGGILMMLGQFTLFGFNNEMGLYTGLALLCIGNGFFKPNISVLVGGLYKDGDPKRDSAFSIFYMGVNLGAFIAPLLIGYFSDDLFSTQNADGTIAYGYRYGFLASGIGMLFGQLLFNGLAKKYLGNVGLLKKKEQHKEVKVVEVSAADQRVELEKILAIFVFFFFAVFFWAAFEQAGSSLSIYTDKYIDRNITLPWIGAFEVPTAWFQSLNPAFIMILAPVFAVFWNSSLGRKLPTPVKMGSGLVLLGVGFFFMLGAIEERGGDFEGNTKKAALLWMVFTYLFHTVGELCISPVGLSVVTRLSPARLASILMAIWLLASSLANLVGGQLAIYVERLGAKDIFTYVSITMIVCGAVMILLTKPILKLMHGVR